MIRASAQAAGSPHGRADEQEASDLGQHEAADGGRIGAEGHAHADLPPPLGDREGEHAVDPDRGQKRREAAEGDGKDEDEPLGQRATRGSGPSAS